VPLIDTDMIIAYLKGEDRWAEHAERMFVKILSGEIKAYVSPALLMEVAFVLKRNERLELLDDLNKIIFGIDRISIVDFNEKIARMSFKLMQDGIGVMDSIQAATALDKDQMIISSDHIFDQIYGLERIKPKDI
jgi:predicted nucleic acid-binding protein